jgi:hypothetical protein
MGVLPQALEIIFEMQRKRSNEKIIRKKKVFSTYKMYYLFIYFLFSLDPLTFKPHNFIIFYSFFKRFKIM